MVRKIRYRQILRHRCANRGRGTYAQQVQLQKLFWREDEAPTPTIEKVREIHTSLGSWDKDTVWYSITYRGSGYVENIIESSTGRWINPKANYKPINEPYIKVKELHWKEQEKRTLEFFEREGC